MNLKRVLVVIIGIICHFGTSAQKSQDAWCGTTELDKINKSRDPNYEIFRNAQDRAVLNGSYDLKTGGLIQIPVVVHVIYRLDAQNISDEQIQSQIDALNKDYRANNWDTMLVPSVCKHLIADCEIEFVLANRDINGKIHSGITRTQTSVVDICKLGGDVYYNSIKGGHDIWDRNSYLNFWVCELEGSLYGFSTLPGAAKESDGIVIDWESFGTIGTAKYPSDKGRTCTHEVGHWLNLKHIFGTTVCGDDMVPDTPLQEKENYGCPSFPKISSMCGNGPDGDMFMNYMDYTQDKCMYMFTKGQKTRMLSTLLGARASLASSKGYNGVNSVVRPSFSIGPNPANLALIVNSDQAEEINTIRLFSISGQEVYSSAGRIPKDSHSIDLRDVDNGIYILGISTPSGTYSEKIIVQHD